MSACRRLVGRLAVVTASTDGIGFAIARRLAQEGARVIVSSRKPENVQRAVTKLLGEGLDVTGISCHVASSSDRKGLFEKARDWGGGAPLDILISNAGVNPVAGMTHVLNCPPDIWDKIFDVNLKASYMLAREALPLMLSDGQQTAKAGRIIFLSSIAGFQTPCKPMSVLGAYSVSKTALHALTKAAAFQCAQHNITVNCLVPGITQTSFAEKLLVDDEIRRSSFDLLPLKRLAHPEDISGTAAFLASDDAAFITGESVVVAGGMPSRI